MRNSERLVKVYNSDFAKSTQAYKELRDKVIAAGILKRSYLYYWSITAVAVTGLVFSFWQVYTTANFLLTFGWVVVLAFFAVQVGGLMHDSGHRAIFNSVFMNDLMGHISATLVGMPFGEWRTVHNQHHSHPNQIDEDPDIELPLISLNRDRYLEKKGVSKLLRPYQMYLWYPLGSLVSFSKRLYAVKYFRKNFSVWILPEIVLYLIGLFIWFVMPFLLLDLGKAFMVFFASNLLFGVYLANIFAPNHKGMPQLGKGVKLTFLEQQVMTSRNVYGHPLTDIAYIGLNYQIEHHLFPNCPRNKLKLVKPIAKETCKKLGIEFTEVGFIESNIIILKELNEVVREAKQYQLSLSS